MSRSRSPRRRALALATAATLAAGAAALVPTGRADATDAPATSVTVVVRTDAASLAAVEAAVTALGGTVAGELPIIGGFAASVPSTSADLVRALPGVLTAVPDQKVWFTAAPAPGPAPSAPVDTFLDSTGARALRNRGITGRGVTVAVLDSGVSPVADLAGRVEYGPDLSTEHTVTDGVGHGTAMAGLIAGDGSSSPDGRKGYGGVAPGARLVAVKASGRDGQTDLVAVLRGLEWISTHSAQYGIRVVNLSLGVLSQDDPALQPIDIAVERLWQQGLVVVVSAGNAGSGPGSVTAPGSDPLVITAGATDEHATAATADDAVPTWSSRGPTRQGVAKPDVVVPGRSLVTTAAPGSVAVTDNPQALVPGGYILGSGTSEAAAVTSGLVALLLQSRPWLTPDQVKAVLRGTAVPMAGVPVTAQGAGQVAAAAADLASPGLPTTQLPSLPTLGSLPALLQAAAWDGGSWQGTRWEGTRWEGTRWEGTRWEGTRWEGTRWEGTRWEGTRWEGTRWEGAGWGADPAPAPGDGS